MNPLHLSEYEKIPQPPRESFGFIEDIKKPLSYHFQPGRGCDAGTCANCLANGVELIFPVPLDKDFPETAITSLRRVLTAKKIVEKADAYPIVFNYDTELSQEEYRLTVTPEQALIQAADNDGFRRAIYFLEDRICEAEGQSVMPGTWQRKPFIKNRISRCFFGPTNRAPFFIDELTNDVDYYPDEYMNKLAHEGVNGLWLTMYFTDFPSSIFPHHGADIEKRFAKLRLTVERCARFGIRIFVFLSEPKFFGPVKGCGTHGPTCEEGADHPELLAARLGEKSTFCTSTEAGKTYLRECTELLFKSVPDLGGIINIMFGEDNGSCAHRLTAVDPLPGGICPVCSKRDPADILAEQAQLMTDAMHKYTPRAEYIGWLYAPGQRDGKILSKRLLHIAEKWPKDASLLLNFESGADSIQHGHKCVVLDYSLAFVGPSKLFAEAAKVVPKMAAKLQVGCSHEDASIPFIPVPENLYDKYKFMEGHNVSNVMQCWYFGNYPGLMNKAAGELSFSPVPSDAMEFLTALARPDWRQDAPIVAQAWHNFSMAYRNFPSCMSFEWYGPMHDCIAWPLHLFPTDTPISPSWKILDFPVVSGDRIGECLALLHTIPEALGLCTTMSDTWQAGLKPLLNLREKYANDTPRLMDIDLAETVGIQMKSTQNLLAFYSLREDMLYNHIDHLDEMKKIVLDEIQNTIRMTELSEKDCRLGYHSEAEGYLFFPEKLRFRAKLLQELLDEDFPKFDLNAPWVDEYTGKNTSTRKAAVAVKKGNTPKWYPLGNDSKWCASHDGEALSLTITNAKGQDITIDFSPARLMVNPRITVHADGHLRFEESYFADFPEITYDFQGNDLNIIIPLDKFKRFMHPGFPVQFNIRGADRFWVDPQPWPNRPGQHMNYNPNGTGWLSFE